MSIQVNSCHSIILGAALAALSPMFSRAAENEKPEVLPALISAKWGASRVVLPSATVLVQYEADLGERWIVDFESGGVLLEFLCSAETELDSDAVQAAMACAVSNLYVSVPVLPEMMLSQQQQDGYVPSQVSRDELVRRDDVWVYTVIKGDTLSAIAKRFRVELSAIVGANNLRDPNRIDINQTLIIPESLPHMHLAGDDVVRTSVSLLRDQFVDPDTGNAITVQNVAAYGRRMTQRNGVENELIQGGDGHERRILRLRIGLAENHLQVRAKRYYPLVREYAQRFGHDPAVIMAMVHTESAFNPMAASSANAYGLMQLVPSSGGREAYRWLYSKDIAPTPAYLLRSRENVELGTAYLKVLKERIFRGVRNPDSRLYCAVAAYNGGGGNVGRAFTGRKSVQASLSSINAATPEQVLQKLVASSPHQETRDYVQRVFARAALYREPNWLAARL